MIIPTLKEHIRKFKVGDKVVLLEDVERGYFMLTRGHELTIIDKDGYGWVFKDEETGIVIKNMQCIKLSHKVTLEDSKRLLKNYKDKNKFIKFIKDNCTKKDYGYWERDRYDSCKLKNNHSFSNDECICKFDCLKYVPKSKYENNSFILNYNRKLKLNKISNGNIKKNK